MGRLLYFQPCSLDLRIADAAGRFDWSELDAETHGFMNDLMRPIRTVVYGRRMWETMRFWETMPEEESVMGDFGAVWRASDKVVVSGSLQSVDTARTELMRRFDAEDLRSRTAAADTDVAVGGAQLAAAALAAGLVDEIGLMLLPVLVGAGPRALPDGVESRLRLEESRTFASGWTYLRYAVGAA